MNMLMTYDVKNTLKTASKALFRACYWFALNTLHDRACKGLKVGNKKPPEGG
jgi:hypothetical protein